MSQAILIRRLALLVVLLSSAGCGQRFATVEGTVTLDGKPANRGEVIFSGPGNYTASGTIRPDGSFVAENVPVGEVKASFLQMLGGPARPGQLQGIPGAEDGISGGAPLPPVLIPKKYQSVETSGLSYKVTSGTNKIDIELSSK